MIRKLFAGASVLAVAVIAIMLAGSVVEPRASAAAPPAYGTYCHANTVIVVNTPALYTQHVTTEGDWPVLAGRNNDAAVCTNASIVKPAGYGRALFACRDGSVVVLGAGGLGYQPGDHFIWSLTELGLCMPAS